MKAILVAGLGFGDESKGATVDKLCRELPIDLIVRYNGGSQAAHNCVTPEGVHHTFSQFGSGMLANNTVRTHLSRFMLVDPIYMMNEADALARKTPIVWRRTSVSPSSVIITPFHKRLNRLRETARGEDRHGSCGMGVGVAREFELNHGDSVLRAGDINDWVERRDKLRLIKNLVEKEVGVSAVSDLDVNNICADYADWKKLVRMAEDNSEAAIGGADCMVFEGAQGVLLDEKHGTAPHNTWTNTTFENADTLLDEVGVKDRFRIGCLRTYHTRHGAGPFRTEDKKLDLPEPHNGVNEFQGSFRVGHFDEVALFDAMQIVKYVDGFALSHLDYMDRLGYDEGYFINGLERKENGKAPVVMKSYGPTAAHRTLELGVYA